MDLKVVLQQWVDLNDVDVVVILSVVGSLMDYVICFVNQFEVSVGQGYFEIISMIGILFKNGFYLYLIVVDEIGYCLVR